jgi:hypothetical protein
VASLVRNAPRPGGAGADVAAILDPKACGSPEEIVEALGRAVLLQPRPAEKRSELVGALAGLPPCASWATRRDEVNAKLRNVLVLLMSTPEYQMF